MVCLVFELEAAGWWAQTKPQSYDGHPVVCLNGPFLASFAFVFEFVAVVVAQLAVQLLPIAEVHCWNPVIGSFYCEHIYC